MVRPAVFRLPMVLELLVGERRVRLPIDVQQRKQTIQIPLPQKPRYVALDPEHDLMKLMEFPRSAEELLHGLAESTFVLERIRCARELAASGHERRGRGVGKGRAASDRFWGRAHRGHRLPGRDRDAAAPTWWNAS